MQKPPNRPGTALHKPASRPTLRVALATGTTVAALIGAQAIAIFGRTAQAKPVIVGAHADDSDTAVPSAAATQTDVPASATALSPSATPQPSSTQTKTVTALPSTIPVPRVYYTVKSGDTLGRIAARFKTSVQSLMALNTGTLTNSNLVQVGQKLLIAGPLPTTPTQTSTATDSTAALSEATDAPSATLWPTSTPLPTWTPLPTQVYHAPVQPAPKTKSS